MIHITFNYLIIYFLQFFAIIFSCCLCFVVLCFMRFIGCFIPLSLGFACLRVSGFSLLWKLLCLILSLGPCKCQFWRLGFGWWNRAYLSICSQILIGSFRLDLAFSPGHPHLRLRCWSLSRAKSCRLPLKTLAVEAFWRRFHLVFSYCSADILVRRTGDFLSPAGGSTAWWRLAVGGEFYPRCGVIRL